MPRPQRECPFAHCRCFHAYEVLPLALTDVAHRGRALRPGVPHDRRARAVLVHDDTPSQLRVDDLDLRRGGVDAVGRPDKSDVAALGGVAFADLVVVAFAVQSLHRHVLDVADVQVGVQGRFDREGVVVLVREGQGHVQFVPRGYVKTRAERVGVEGGRLARVVQLEGERGRGVVRGLRA